MTLHHFNELNEVEQVDAICEHGVLVGDRKDDNYTVLLFQINSFYVEVFYSQPYNELRKYKSFSSTTLLQPYLEKIDLERIFNQ